MPGATLVWYRHDLRIADHPPLRYAAARGGAVIPCWIWAPEEEGDWPPGAASRWRLHHSLVALDRALRGIGSRLIVRRGPTEPALRALIRETGAEAVVWSRRYEPAAAACEATVADRLRRLGIEAVSYPGCVLHDPAALRTKAGLPYRVFTPFARACLAQTEWAEPLPPPARLRGGAAWPESVPIEALGLLPKRDWAAEFPAFSPQRDESAAAALERFVRGACADYAAQRDRLDADGTSRLSAALHFGEVSPRQVWHAVRTTGGGAAGDAYLRQLLWREFAYHLLVNFPESPRQPLRREFDGFPWVDDRGSFRAWQRGGTGFPIVDAGMRELWRTGWMHNRARMIAASFLVKDLLVPWTRGAEWFWDTLVDADLANNTLGWQWCAGCGADAAPFFRIFHPVRQGARFDLSGEYVRRWVPELAGLPSKWIHRPWEAPAGELARCGVVLGTTYPRPIVDHDEARRRALAAWRALRRR